MKKVFHTERYPSTKGRPYSQAIIANGFIFISGASPRDPKTGEKSTDLKEQTRQELKNIEQLLEDAGTSIDNIVKVTVFLKTLDDYKAMNEVYSTFFQKNPPARTCIAVSDLPGGNLVEIEAIAVIP